MKAGKIKFSELRDIRTRLDGSYHLSDAQLVKTSISKSPYRLIPLSEVSERIWHAGRWKRVYVDSPESGITLLGSSAMLKSDLSREKLVSKKYTNDTQDKILQAGWILISCSGTIGNCAFTNAQHAGKLASQHVIRLKPNNILGAGLKAGVIYAYLASKYGYVLLTQGTSGSVIQHIEPENVENILIPQFPEDFQLEVDKLIQESACLREEAADAMTEVKDFFEDHFKLMQQNKSPQRVSINKIINGDNKRFDSTYYTTKGAKYDEIIKTNYTWRPLSEFFSDISRPDIFKRMYVKSGCGRMFFGCTELFLANPKSSKFVSNRTPELHSLVLQEGWVLLPRSGTIGEVAYATSQHAQKLASEDVIRLKPDNILRGAYAYGFLSSSIGREMLERLVFGSVIQHVEPPLLRTIPVPWFESDFERIANMVVTANKKLGKAGELEIKAISMVEAEIEKWKS